MLAGEGVDVVIAGGWVLAQQLFNQQNIQVIVGASGPVDAVLAAYLKGKLETGHNVCVIIKRFHAAKLRRVLLMMP